VIDLLCGVMTGALFGSHFHGPLAEDMEHPMDVGHIFAVLDPSRFLPLDTFKARMDQALSELRSCPPAAGSQGVLIPGDIERNERERRLRDGIPLPEAVIADFQHLSAEFGVPMPEALPQ
jgi:LDH2 family malate/lactate/ureidoglycolate dehydrogenase